MAKPRRIDPLLGSREERPYDVFISYSHAQDSAIAEALQRELRRFGVPWYSHRPALPGARRTAQPNRPLHVFRDVTNLTASPGLWPNIVRALGSSEWLIVMASPTAAGSPWVGDEVGWWLANRPVERILIAWTAGELAWRGDDFDWDHTDAVPKELAGAFAHEPRWIDLRPVRPKATATKSRIHLGDQVAEFAAPIRGVAKDALVGEHIRQRRRTRFTAGAAVVLLTALSVVASFAAVRATSDAATARAQENVALSRQLAAESSEIGSQSPGVAARLAEAAWAVSPTTQAGAALTSLLDNQVHEGMLVTSFAAISSVAYSPDGTILASGDQSGQIQLRDAQTQTPLTRPIQVVHGDDSQVDSLAFAPDGKVLAVAGSDGEVHFRNPATGSPDRPDLKAAGSDAGVETVAYSRDGRMLATVDSDGEVDVWDASAGYSLIWSTALGDQTVAYPLAFSPDGTTLAGGGDSDGTIRLWAAATGHALGSPIAAVGGGGQVDSVAFSPDGRTLADVGSDGTTKLWNLSTRTATVLPSADAGQTQGSSVAFSPNGRLVGEGGYDGVLHLWDSQTGKAVAPAIAASPGTSIVYAVAFSPDSRVLAAGDSDGIIRLRETITGDPVGAPLGQPSAGLQPTISFDARGAEAAEEEPEDGIQLINPANGQPTDAGFSTGLAATLVELSPNDRALAADDGDSVKIFDVARPRSVHTVVNQTSGSDFVDQPSMAFSSDGRILATSENHADAQLWNTTTGKLLSTLGATKDSVSVISMAFSPDGTTLVTGHYDGTLEFWDVDTGVLRDTYHVGDPIDSLAFSPNGGILAVGDNEGIERLYAPASMRLLVPALPVGDDGTFGYQHEEKGVAAVAFSADGGLMAIAENDGTLRFWKTATGTPIGAVITPASGVVDALAFSENGTTLFTAGSHGIESWPVHMFTDPLAALCAEVGPPTAQDWTDYASGEPIPAVCTGSS